MDEALNKGFIFGADLDVFEKKPPNTNNPLLKNKKVLLSPHSSTFTEECTERMGKETIQNIIDFFDGRLDQSMVVQLWAKVLVKFKIFYHSNLWFLLSQNIKRIFT